METNFFDISSVAIIWASETEGKIGNTLLKNLKPFAGVKMGVNPKGGQREDVVFYPTVADLPNVPDVAVIAIPAKFAVQSLEECGKKWIKRVIIITAGFKETGNIEGEQAIIDIAQKYGISVLGPNCLGYVDVHKDLNLSFGGKQINKGNIAVVSQSGAMAVALMDWALGNQVGFSKLISLGNKAVMSGNTVLKLLAEDPNTSVIVVYLESINDGRTLFELTRWLSKKKPIIMVKSGLSTRGQAAASSHTGALSGANEVLKAAVDHSGIHFTSSLEDLTLRGEVFAKTANINIPDSLAILTNAGGPGVMVTDHCEMHNIAIANFSEAEQAILKEGMPDAASMNNPIDIIGDATSVTYEKALDNIAKLNRKDIGILVLLTPQAVTDVDTIAEKIVAWHKAHPSVFLMVSCMGEASVKNARQILRDNGILWYDYPRKAILAMRELMKQKKWAATPIETVEPLVQPDVAIVTELQQELAQEEKLCNNDLTAKILKTFGVNFLEDKIAHNEEDVVRIFSEAKNKLVAKIVSKDIAHKTDCGWVVIGISTLEWVKEAYNNILTNVKKHHPDAEIAGVMFQEMLPPSKEIFIGMQRDINFGEVLIVGMGGIFVNVYEDVSMELSPVSKAEIKNMFTKLKGYPILDGARWDTPVDLDSLVDMVFGVASLFRALPQIKEIDINPAFANEHGSIIVDAKLYV